MLIILAHSDTKEITVVVQQPRNISSRKQVFSNRAGQVRKMRQKRY